MERKGGGLFADGRLQVVGEQSLKNLQIQVIVSLRQNCEAIRVHMFLMDVHVVPDG